MGFVDDYDVYYYIRWRLKLDGETENTGVCTKERKGVAAEVLMATPCTKSLGGGSPERRFWFKSLGGGSRRFRSEASGLFFLKKNDFWLSELELGTVDKKGCDKPEVREKYVGFLCYCLLYHFTTARRKSGGSYRRSYFFFAPVDFTTVQDPSRDSRDARQRKVSAIGTILQRAQRPAAGFCDAQTSVAVPIARWKQLSCGGRHHQH